VAEQALATAISVTRLSAPLRHTSLTTRRSIVGPDYISLIGGEVRNPRRILPRAFNSTIYRIVFFYLTGALCVGIVAASDDPSLLGAIAAGAPGAAKSPYVICAWRHQSSLSLLYSCASQCKMISCPLFPPTAPFRATSSMTSPSMSQPSLTHLPAR
jgi:hypothetical protein